MISWKDVCNDPQKAEEKIKRQERIDRFHKGDEQAYRLYQAQGRGQKIKWDDISSSVQTLPTLEKECLDVIRSVLGYLPHRSCTLPHEPFIRHLMELHRKGSVSFEEYRQNLEEHVRHIRNADIEGSCWNFYVQHPPAMHKEYETYCIAQSQKAKERITRFLGYLPDVAASMEAELFLRDLLASDSCILPDTLTELDVRLLSVIKYREVFVSEGRDIADASPLFDTTTIKNTGFADLDEKIAAFNDIRNDY